MLPIPIRIERDQLPADLRRAAEALNGARPWHFSTTLVMAWVVIFAAIALAQWAGHWWATLLAICVVATRMNILGLLVHDQVHLLGYRHPEVEAAAQAQAALGDCLNGPTPRFVELAEALVDTIAHADWVLFQKNGTDATTVALMVPEKSLLFSVVPLPSNLLPWLPPAEALAKELLLKKGIALSEASTEEALSTELVDFCTALTFSAICTIRMSPTRRARRSSNRGRVKLGW